MVQWLRLHASRAGGTGSIHVRELRVHMPQSSAKKRTFVVVKEGGQDGLVSKSKVILGYSSLLLGVGVEKAISYARFPFLREKEEAALE